MKIDFSRFFWPVVITITGLMLNYAVIQANGAMPVPGIISQGRWVAMNSTTLLPYLGDVLPLDFSIGDVLMIGGLIAAVAVGYQLMSQRVTAKG